MITTSANCALSCKHKQHQCQKKKKALWICIIKRNAHNHCTNYSSSLHMGTIWPNAHKKSLNIPINIYTRQSWLSHQHGILWFQNSTLLISPFIQRVRRFPSSFFMPSASMLRHLNKRHPKKKLFISFHHINCTSAFSLSFFL